MFNREQNCMMTNAKRNADYVFLIVCLFVTIIVQMNCRIENIYLLVFLVTSHFQCCKCCSYYIEVGILVMIDEKIEIHCYHCLFQLQVLIDDSTRLQTTYPGENAEQIAQLQAAVVDDWEELQNKSDHRKALLLAAADLHRFMASVSLYTTSFLLGYQQVCAYVLFSTI